jgi:hypothetical protein
VRARNLTRDSALAEHVEVAASLWAKFVGLMGRSSLPAGHALWLPESNGIHMFFMRFAIDVVFLDRSLRVTKVVHAIKPWRVALGGGGHSALELLPGAALAAGVEVGDLIEFETAER